MKIEIEVNESTAKAVTASIVNMIRRPEECGLTFGFAKVSKKDDLSVDSKMSETVQI